MKIKSALTVIMVFAAGASHSLADVSEGAGRTDYRIEILAGNNNPATFIPVTKQAWSYIVYIHGGSWIRVRADSCCRTLSR